MLIDQISTEMMKEYKKIHKEYRPTLRPNRKSGREIDEFLHEKYSPKRMESHEFKEMIKAEVLENNYAREKLSDHSKLQIVSYIIEDNIFIGLDLYTGFFHVESEDIEKMQSIYDELFVFRGLDEQDLENYFLVAQYVLLKFSK